MLTAACSTPAATETAVDDAVDTLAADVTLTTDGGVDAADAAQACPGGGGCACATDAECGSKHCLADEAGAKTCARACGGLGCPTGFACGTLDKLALCIPLRVNLCEPCLNDSNECAIAGLPGAACVKYGNMGAFCGAACLSDGDCGSGFACRSVERVEGGQSQQCVKVEGGVLAECTCSQRAIDAKKSTFCGVSAGKHTCEGTRNCSDAGLGLCDALTPSAETCDGVDNDCNGATDEGTCSDTNPCTDDVCGGSAGCSHPFNSAPCSDGSDCTLNDACVGGNCKGTSDTCDDGNACTTDSCAGSGCAHVSATGACDDGDKCTVGDACKNSVCLPGAVTNCNDGKDCTSDACSSADGCVYTPATGGICNDNDACTLADACSEGTCKGGALNCDDGNPCTTESCDSAKGCVVVSADGAGCSDDNPCTDGDLCGGGACNGIVKTCVSQGACVVAFCSAVSGGCGFVQKADGAACNDGDACTTGDACLTGACTGSNADCSDGNACTADSCSVASGCGHVALTGTCDDGNTCTSGDNCSTGTCLGTALDCDDAKPCTDDSCAAGVCKHVNHVGSCDDGQVCTAGDTCSSGTCVGLTATDCTDSDPCTDDSCNPASGCKHVANSTGACDLDGSKCTADTCAAGICTAGVAKVCDDGLSCTTDACDTATGNCTFTPVSDGTPCDDANNCTTPDACQAGTCVGNQPPNAVSTYAGQGTAGSSNNTDPLTASFNGPRSVALDSAGSLFVADTGNALIRKIAANGAVTSWAGDGIPGYAEGVGATARFHGPQSVVVAGTVLYVSDSDIQNIRRIGADQTTSLLAGSAVDPAFPAQQNPGDYVDGPVADARFNAPMGLAWASASNLLYVADQGNNRIRVIDIGAGTVATLTGTGVAGHTDGAFASATFNQPTGLWLSADAKKLYVTDIGSDMVRLIDFTANTVSTIAGSGSSGSSNGANLTVASFNAPIGITGDGTTLWLADRGNNRIRAVSATTSSTLTGSVGSPFVNGVFSAATFSQPSGILWVSAGLWYVADTKNNRIRKLLDPNAGCIP
jgi:DNA-binding beta-propeller fold protein YncE